jgi:hypothetical protein
MSEDKQHFKNEQMGQSCGKFKIIDIHVIGAILKYKTNFQSLRKRHIGIKELNDVELIQ